MTTGAEAIAVRLRAAFEVRDPALLAPLLADDVRWGDDDNPNRCRNRGQVLDRLTFAVGAGGIDAEIGDMVAGRHGILCPLVLHRPTGPAEPIFHVYMVRDDRITEIRRYDDRPSAAEAAGLDEPPRA